MWATTIDDRHPAGEFAEMVRGQFMEERVEHFKRVETALYEETGFQEECTPAQVASALLSLDPELSEKQVCVFTFCTRKATARGPSAAGVWDCLVRC